MRYNRALEFRFDEITNIEKPRTVEDKFKIYADSGKHSFLHPKLYDDEMIAFIEAKYQKRAPILHLLE